MGDLSDEELSPGRLKRLEQVFENSIAIDGLCCGGGSHTGFIRGRRSRDSCQSWKFMMQGVAGLYKGILPNLAKVAPAAGISWVVFEEVKLFLGVDPKS